MTHVIKKYRFDTFSPNSKLIDIINDGNEGITLAKLWIIERLENMHRNQLLLERVEIGDMK